MLELWVLASANFASNPSFDPIVAHGIFAKTVLFLQ